MVIKKKGIVLINSILILFIIVTIALSTTALIIRRGEFMSENINKGSLYYENKELLQAITAINNEIIKFNIDEVLKEGFKVEISDCKLVYVKKDNDFKLDYKDKYSYTSRRLRYIKGKACTCELTDCKFEKGDRIIILPSAEVKYEKINN